MPKSLPVEIALLDESISEIPDTIDADMIGMTVITGNAPRAYELAARFRAKGITVVLGGPHVTLLPEEATLHADSICVGYAEQSWPRLIRDLLAGDLKPRYQQDTDFHLDDPDLPFPERHLFDDKNFLTQAVFEATRSCTHNCEFCVAPSAWGRKQFQHPVEWVVNDIRQFIARTGNAS